MNNLIDVNILNYNIDLTNNETKLLAFLNLGEKLGKSYISTYKAYKKAENIATKKRLSYEKEQIIKLSSPKTKILLAGHSYNLYDALIGQDIINFLTENNIEIIYSDRIPHKIIDSECSKLSTDINWTYNKEIVAAINYYHNKVSGIIIISTFPCGPDSLSTELILHKIKNIPIINLIFDDLSNNTGIITRLESFIDILNNLKEQHYD